MSIKEELLEECYELIEAIESNDAESITEELGDTLLNLLMHMSIAENDQSFTPKDVYKTLIEKLINRHPHVFSNPTKMTLQEIVSASDVRDMDLQHVWHPMLQHQTLKNHHQMLFQMFL